MYDLARGAGLVRHERGAEHSLCGGGDFLVGATEFDAAGLAATPGVNLCLDGPMPAPKFRRDVYRLLRTVSDPARRHRYAKAGQQFFCLIFVNIHRTPEQIPWVHPPAALGSRPNREG